MSKNVKSFYVIIIGELGLILTFLTYWLLFKMLYTNMIFIKGFYMIRIKTYIKGARC